MSSTRTAASDEAEQSGGQLTEVATALQISAAPFPWSGRRSKAAVTFRGRVMPGLAQLPATPVLGVDQGITFGLASAPVILENVGGAHQIPANTPWAVPSDGTWRVVFTRTADLRLVHVDGAEMKAPTLVRRPLRFHGNCERAMRAAISPSTPVWVDERCRPVSNLASLQVSAVRSHPSAVRPVNPSVDHDSVTAFVMLATWALEQHPRDSDPRLDRVVDYIDTHLADAALSTETIAAGCAISRRTLQTLFADQGGIAAYLRRRRLVAVIGLLIADAELLPDLDEVALATGLGSRRTLERAMRQVYDLTPRQARAQVLAGFPLHELEVAVLRAS